MVEAGSLKRGDYVDIDGEPFRILSLQSVVTSRHTHTKIKLEALGMFTDNKKALSIPQDEKFEKVELIRKHGQLISKTSVDACQVMDLREYSIHDATISKDLLERLGEGDEVTYIDFRGRARVLDARD